MKSLVTIGDIQGDALFSRFAGQRVETQGVVTGILRQGFYIQTPNVSWDGRCSDGIFVFVDIDHKATFGPDQLVVPRLTTHIGMGLEFQTVVLAATRFSLQPGNRC